MSGSKKKSYFLGFPVAALVLLTVFLPGAGAVTGRRSRSPVAPPARAAGATTLANGMSVALPATPDEVKVWPHIQYFDDQVKDPGPLEMHQLNVYHPKNQAHPTVLFFVHGGAFKQGNIYEPEHPEEGEYAYDTLARTLSGYCHYTTVVINYELSNPEDGSAVHPDHVQDVARAFAWVKKNISKYGGDSGDIFVFGQSAGGHLASLLSTKGSYLAAEGCSKSDIRGTITMSGLHDLYNLVQYPRNPYQMSAEDVLIYKGMFAFAFGGWSREKLDDASPYRYLSSAQPQFCIVASEKNMPGLQKDADHFWEKMKTFSGQIPTRVTLREVDYSPVTWATAVEWAADDHFSEEVAGHYAEVISINPGDINVPGHPEYATSLVTIRDFIESR